LNKVLDFSKMEGSFEEFRKLHRWMSLVSNTSKVSAATVEKLVAYCKPLFTTEMKLYLRHLDTAVAPAADAEAQK